MKILGEIPSYVVTLESDFKAYCLKCKGKRGIRDEKYKAYKEGLVLERGNCIQCGSYLRSFRKAKFYSKTSYRGKDTSKKWVNYPRLPLPDLDRLLGKEQGRDIRRSRKYHSLRNVTLAIDDLEMPTSRVARRIIAARNRNPIEVKSK